jgi:hypothetical protein
MECKLRGWALQNFESALLIHHLQGRPLELPRRWCDSVRDGLEAWSEGDEGLE